MLSVSILDRASQFEALQAEWTALLAHSTSDVPFMTWEWAFSWWKAYGADAQLWIVEVRSGNELIGLAPLYLRTFRRYGIEFRGAYLIGDGSHDSDYLDFIAATGREEAVVSEIAKTLSERSRPWDILFLSELPASSRNLELIRRNLHSGRWHWSESSVPCAFIELPESWDVYLKQLRPRMRTKVRSQRPQFESRFSTDIAKCNDPSHLGKILDSLFALHGERWNLKNQAGVFNSSAKRKFYLEMAERFLSRGWLRLYSLRADGAYAAHQFCLEYKNRMFLLQEGFNPALIDYSIGNVLRTYVLEDCIARKLRVYDFLSGVSAHKLSWGAKEKTSVRVAASPRSIKGFIYFGVEDAVLETKSALRRMLPAQAFNALKRLMVAMQRHEARPRMSPLTPPATSDTAPTGKH